MPSFPEPSWWNGDDADNSERLPEPCEWCGAEWDQPCTDGCLCDRCTFDPEPFEAEELECVAA